MVFKGTLINPMDGVNLVRHQLLEFRACHITNQQAADPYVETDCAIFAGQQVRWRRPTYGVLKVNCDGAWCGKSLQGGYRWVMRDFAGLLQMAGGVGGLFFNNAAMAEAAAIRAALVVCIEEGCDVVEIESDSQSLIRMLQEAYAIDASLECFIHDIRCLVSQQGEVRFLYVKRKGNAVVHAVASYVTSHGGDFQ